MTIAASHFIEGKTPQDHPANTKPGTDVSPKLVGMMQDAFGKDVDFYSIRRVLIASTDDTKLLIITGKISTHCKENEMLVSSVNDKKTQMYYIKSCDDDDKNIKVMRVKLTFTFTVVGQVFYPYVKLSGLTERYLPPNEFPYVILVVPIPGLSMERNRYPTCQKNGYVVFLRNTVSEEYIHLKKMSIITKKYTRHVWIIFTR